MPQTAGDVRPPALVDKLAAWLGYAPTVPHPTPTPPQYWDSPAQIWARHVGYPVPRDPALADVWMMQGDVIGPTGGRTLGAYDPDKKLAWYSDIPAKEQRHAVAHELSHAILYDLPTLEWDDFSRGLINVMGFEKFKSYSSYEWPHAEVLATYVTAPEQLDPKVHDYIRQFFESRRKAK